MSILGGIIKKAIEVRGKRISRKSLSRQQHTVLKKLLKKAEMTAFGEHHQFTEILKSNQIEIAFQKAVPIHDYNSMFKNWWYRTLQGEPYVCWPGHIKYFALSSGTSEASSKHIPVTLDMLKLIRKVSIRQILTMSFLDLPPEQFEKGVLMIGGSTHLNYNGTYFEGDLSGITTGNIPFWFQHFYKPGPKISKYRDWNTKIEEIVKNAKQWDIGIICGVPAWIQIIFEKIIAYYNVKTIHDIWPNLRIHVSGGVALGPYKTSFDKLTSYPLIHTDSYLASEGFIAYQANPDTIGNVGPMKLVTDLGIFFEFIPFNDTNFDSDGNLLPNAKAILINEVQLQKEYAILISTCAGAWRYLIGDVIKFTNIKTGEIEISGRTKHFLSLCGEHLSVDNMTKAVQLTAEKFGAKVNEYTVVGEQFDNLFAHRWYVGMDVEINNKSFKESLDENLKILNDDYRVERTSALKEVIVEFIPNKWFIDFMEYRGKISAQSKLPRVMKGKMLEDWNAFLNSKKN
jgi:hypothetical protein